MFIMLLGQETFAKLKVLASPMTMNGLTLDAVVQLLTQDFHLATIKIAELFKFLKQNQKDESATKYIGQLRGPGQMCNLGMYLQIALWDQFFMV